MTERDANHDPGASGRQTTRSLLKAAVIVLLLVLATAGLQSWRVLADQRAHAADLERRIDESQERIEALRDRIHRIENDPATLERLAREELGWVHDGDLVIVLPEDLSVDAAGDASRTPLGATSPAPRRR